MRVSPRLAFALAFCALLATKAWLAWQLPLFGDESFYWLESRHPAFGYSDVPGLTPWLVALGRSLGGDTPFGVRWPFLLLGTALPLLVLAWARRFLGAPDALRAGALALLLPLAATLGVLALPDVPLTCATLLGALALERALRSGRTLDFLAFAACIALGWLSHYRFVLVLAAGFVFLLAFPRGAALLRERRFWLALALGMLGLAPSLWFNWHGDWSALRFQFLDRHPWAFHPDALLEPVVQALVTTPLLFAAIVVAVVHAWQRGRREGAPWDLPAALGGGLLAVVLVAVLFADAQRTRFHWPLPAYLLALPAVPLVLRRWRESRHALVRALPAATLALAAAGTLVVFGLLAHATRPAGTAPLRERPLPDNLQGWHEIGGWARSLALKRPGDVLVGGDFMIAAQASFALRGERAVYVLDAPRNAFHGRAAQLALWRRDERALFAGAWRSGLLLFDESSQHARELPAAYRSLCMRFARVAPRAEISLFGGRRRVLAFSVAPTARQRECELPPLAYIDAPARAAVLGGGRATVRGWAISESGGVASVELLVDGVPRGEARYGTDAPQVRSQWPDSRDPNHPRVGFEGELDLTGVAAGEHELALRVRDTHGNARTLAQQRITVR